ncbi:MAG: hypothetical protein ABI016_02495 [Chthoniobacterales bacterium]
MRILVFMNIFRRLQRLSDCPSRAQTPRLLSDSIAGCRVRSILCALIATGLAASAQANVTTLSFQPTPADMNDLDHHMAYTWRIDNISLNGLAVSGAALPITNISNWDTNPDVLHLHLLNTAANSGVRSFIDDPTGSVPQVDLTDDFISARYHSDPNWLVKSGTADTFLADPTFTTTGVNYTLNFSASQLQTLSAYIGNGNDIAFGLDPDCHFFNDGINFSMSLTPVPEMSALFPIIGLIAAVTFTHTLRRRRGAQLIAIEIAGR